LHWITGRHATGFDPLSPDGRGNLCLAKGSQSAGKPESLKAWQGYKFGLLIHMGLYSVDGVIESCGLCPEDWVGRPGFVDYYQYATHYRNNKSKFNPVQFDPQKGEKAFKGSGAKYMIYSTKHHDGFCLYDTKYTDFKVTGKGTPFSRNPKANVYQEIMEPYRLNPSRWERSPIPPRDRIPFMRSICRIKMKPHRPKRSP